jgi:hypothetical protein
VLFRGLDAKTSNRRVQETETRLFGDLVDIFAGVLARLPVSRKLADLRLREVLDRLAVGLGRGIREQRGEGKRGCRDQRQMPRGPAPAARGGRRFVKRIGVGECHA